MKQKLLKNDVTKLKKSLVNRNKLQDKALLESCKNKILKIIHDLSFVNESEYRELFYFENDEDFKSLEKRFIFILLQIFENNIVKKIDHNLKIFINPIYVKKQKYTNYKEKNFFFYTQFKIIMIFEDYLIKELRTIFFWVNKLLLQNYENFKTFSLEDFVIRKISQISHTKFLTIENVKRYHFFNFLQGAVESVSSKFTIVKNDRTDVEDLTADSKIMVQINYNDVAVMAVDFFKDKTNIKKFDPKNQNNVEESFLVAKMPNINFLKKEKFLETWRKVAQSLRENFLNVWAKQDKLYILIRTVQHLFSFVSNEIKEENFKITVSKLINTKFLEIYDIKKFNGEIQEGLNFLWIFNTYNFKAQAANFTYQTVKILTRNDMIVQNIENKLKNLKYDLKIDFLNRFYIENRINSVINGEFYDFKTTYVYSRTKTLCQLSIENVCVGNFIIDWTAKKSYWESLQ